MKMEIVISLLAVVILAGCQAGPSGQTGGKTSEEYASVRQVESGKPVHVMLTSYSTTLRANGADQTMMRLTVADSLGREILSAKDTIRITIDGEGTMTDLRGKPLEITADTAGRTTAQFILKGGEAAFYFVTGTTPGKVKVEASSGKLWPGSHELHTLPGDFLMMTPDESQLPRTTKPIDRMIGADISWLPEMEDQGRKLFDNGVEKDGILLLRDHGFNTVRLRIFVNPGNEKGYSPGKGYCGLSHTLAMAKRVKEAGMELLLNFHYSDYWADPQQQNKPQAWASGNFGALKDSLAVHTARVLLALKLQGTMPAMVQVGNEINHGMLWPDGHIGNPDNLAALLRAGVEAVESVDPAIPVMMHIALGGQHDESVFWLDNMIARGVRFDIIGLSYYPRWHGTLDDLKANLLALAERYHKPLNVVEYSWYKKEIHDIVFSLPGDMGKGTCIWEPFRWGETTTSRQGEVNDLLRIYNDIAARYLTP
ncbi:MAG: glycosyl hydrolase 53 family protein [Prolixibacteraceae bacterium]|jgi:beta-galactosidase|nr:glycosyl hydrolase 53 family protein [Prolixibacteraceae bacterium]MDI9564187.1 glycosyl hydrolase 53 family protein [Bacteroidota bacterium]NLT00894.1 hypothetical protein [Bacteroidales bacterium]HNZ70089.1 glycosyl hydrolase 53 family protein [Prolixibacteraceae bacterium]HOC87629.1 glycosyl hydrolase 53 family protein [Prolixibacteraceae bacterium]